MGASAAYWVVAILIIALASPQIANSQIPTICADEDSLQNMRCCPNECGGAERGTCGAPSSLPDATVADPRSNWPHYYMQICQCMGNFAGYDCSRCKFGYYGENCTSNQVLPRRDITTLSESEFDEYIQILRMTSTRDSGYVAVLSEFVPGNLSVTQTSLTLYQMFVWLHQYAAKDTMCPDPRIPECVFVDYAHKSSGFPTWHRLHIAWLEWEIQYMLRDMNVSDYQNFRLSFWNWAADNRAEVFTAERLGENVGDTSRIQGALFDEGGLDNTICWFGGSGGVPPPPMRICDPRVPTGPILRCPTINGVNVCQSQENWPTVNDIMLAVNQDEYDTPPYNYSSADNGFRNILEGEIPGISDEDCESNPLCVENSKILLHATGHVIPGIGNLLGDPNPETDGVMADVPSSPNDPLFINHHVMVDCILQEWIEEHPDVPYPNIPDTILGHQENAYIVPFFPLYMHRDLYTSAANLGYSCDIPTDIPDSSAINCHMAFHLMIFIAVCCLALKLY